MTLLKTIQLSVLELSQAFILLSRLSHAYRASTEYDKPLDLQCASTTPSYVEYLRHIVTAQLKSTPDFRNHIRMLDRLCTIDSIPISYVLDAEIVGDIAIIRCNYTYLSYGC